MKPTHLLLSPLLLCVTLLLACSERDRNALRPRPIAGDAVFVHAREVVQALADEDGAPGEHHFCIVGSETGHGASAWVYWSEGKRVVLWEPLPDNAGENLKYQDLLISRSSIRLDDDVVETVEEVGTSTYLVTRAWVRELEDACEKMGEKISVVKQAAPDPVTPELEP